MPPRHDGVEFRRHRDDELKLNSYDLAVDVELADAVNGSA
jgi:hypothetical protein